LLDYSENEILKFSYPGKELEAMSFATNYHDWIVDEMKPFLGNKTVEVGAGVGDLSALLLKTSVTHLYAFEPSDNLFVVLKEKFESNPGVTLVNDFLANHELPQDIDSVLYINVLEHIEEDRHELSMARNVIRPGGHLLLFVPALSWLFSEADQQAGHFRRYHLKGLVERVEEAGFRVNRVRYFDIAGIIPWYVNFVLLKNSFSSGSIALYDKLVVPPMRIIEKMITPPLGKNLLLVASRPEFD
jgi:SAM-dependent methyltransferase